MKSDLHILELFRLAPPTRETPESFAEKYRNMPAGNSIPGRYKTHEFEIARAWQRAAVEPGVRKITIMGVPQVSKSTTLENIAGFFISENPCPIMWVLPTESLAIDFARQRLNPYLSNTPILRNGYNVKSRGGDDALLFKRFLNGSTLTVAYAGSESQVAARSARVLIVDEVDRFPLLKEGDSLALAHQRVSSYVRNSLIVQACSPTWSATSRINAEFLVSDQRKAFVQCCHCREWTTLEFFKKNYKCATVEWHRDGDKHDPTSAHLYCGFCGGEFREADRLASLTTKGAIRWMQCREFECCGSKQVPLETRRWEWDDKLQVGWALCDQCGKRAVSNEFVGFQVSRLYSPTITVVGMAQKWIATLNDTVPEATAEFYNLYLGESADPTRFGRTVESHELADRLEHFGNLVPRAVLRLTVGSDIQHDRIAVIVIGWGIGEESWVIDYAELPGDTSQRPVWDDLSKFLRSTYPYNDGVTGSKGFRMNISGACIDAGDGTRMQRVVDFVRNHKTWFATKGAADFGGKWNPITAPLKMTRTRESTKLEIIGTNSAKETLYSRLKIEEHGPGYCHLPHWASGIWLDQLTSEHLRNTIRNGFRTARYVKKREKASNEVLDCWILAHAAHRLLSERLGYKIEKTAVKIEAVIGATP